MNLQLDTFLDHDQLNLLLDYSDILQTRPENHSYDLSISKDKLNLSEKERTREESYEEICKQIKEAKLEQVQLNQQLQQLKQHTYASYLGPFRQEFQQLNQQNLALRAELKQYRTKIKEDKSQRLSNRSSLKPRTSINSVFKDENSKTHSKVLRKQACTNFILKKKENKITESTTNLGKSQIISPRLHRRRESQLTERRMQENNSVGISVNASYYDEKHSARNTEQMEMVTKRQSRKEAGNQNIFVQILQKMLVQQKIRDNQKYCELYLVANERKAMQKAKQQVVFINQLQEEIQITNQKLQMLTIVMNKYQSQIQGMDVNLKIVEESSKKLHSVKGRFVEMEKRCCELIPLRKAVNEKQKFLDKRKQKLLKEDANASSKNISSLETMIKIITNNPNVNFNCKPSALYFNYCKEIKAIFKENTEQLGRRNQKTIKVRQMIDNIRQGRKKFNELIQIYEGRIAKLQEKIARVKGHHLMKSDKSSRK